MNKEMIFKKGRFLYIIAVTLFIGINIGIIFANIGFQSELDVLESQLNELSDILDSIE